MVMVMVIYISISFGVGCDGCPRVLRSHFPYPQQATINVWFRWFNQPGRILITSKLASKNLGHWLLSVESNVIRQNCDRWRLDKPGLSETNT